MARKGSGPKRKINPDPKFHDLVVAKFVNTIMRDGEKAVAERILYGSLDVAQEKSGEDGLKTFKKALENVKPALEVKSRRVGGATYQVPVEVRPERRQALASRWIVDAAKDRPEHTMMERLAGEFVDAAAGRGAAMKKKDDVHRMAEANKAFSHFKW